MSEMSEIALRVAQTRARAEEWALVLTAEGMSPSVRPGSHGFILGVPPQEFKRATAVLVAYESENPEQPLEKDEPLRSASLLVGIAVAGVLLAFFFVTIKTNPSAHWFERGSADAEQILLGEYWRAVTALTLHSNLPHILANAATGAFFLTAVSRMLGGGLGSALVLLAGVGGNLANAVFYRYLHVSLGASTAVFGAVGILCALAVARHHRKGVPWRRAWVPLGAGLALLAMLGTGGQRVDLWAHLFGLLAGGVLGIPVAVFLPRPPAPQFQWMLGGSALIVVIVSWILALR